jgi:hypothetical protein
MMYALVLLQQLFDPTSKGAIALQCDQDTVCRYLFRNQKEFPNVMKETFTTDFLGLSLYKNNFISYTTIKTLKRLIEAGIPQRSYKFLLVDLLDPQIPPEDKSPKVFSLDDLSFGFIIWLYTCAVAGCVFVAELVFYFFFSVVLLAQRLIGLFYFIILLKHHLRIFPV